MTDRPQASSGNELFSEGGPVVEVEVLPPGIPDSTRARSLLEDAQNYLQQKGFSKEQVIRNYPYPKELGQVSALVLALGGQVNYRLPSAR